MSFQPRTLFVIVCNRCRAPFTEPGECGHPVDVVLYETQTGADELVAWMSAEGWTAVGDRHLCPPCVRVEQAAAMDRLAIESAL